MVTPLSDRLLNWGELENSIMYCLAGIEVGIEKVPVISNLEKNKQIKVQQVL